MKEDKFTHEFTPPKLIGLNDQITVIIDSENLDDSLLLDVISEREAFINEHLSSLSKEQSKQFAEAELKVNEQLSTLVSSLFKESMAQLVKIARGRKAIEKYK